MLSLILFVTLPWTAVSFYYAFLASSQYAAEVKLVVRTADPGASDKADSLMAMLGSSLTFTQGT
jgi:capsule polysaccharide export protein KpsE/RkpR